MASVDGDYDDAELAALHRISKAAGLKKKNLSEIFDWVSESWKMGAIGRSIISLQMPGDDEIL